MHRNKAGKAAARCILGAAVVVCLMAASCNRTGHGAASERAGDAVPGVVRLAGSPEEIGTQHGTILRKSIRLMLREYVGADLQGPELNQAVAKLVK